jgi:hypothetical protein
MTCAEWMFGIGVLPKGQRRNRLAAALDGIMSLFDGRILAFDTRPARRYAELAVTTPRQAKACHFRTAASPSSRQRTDSPSRRATSGRSRPLDCARSTPGTSRRAIDRDGERAAPALSPAFPNACRG